MSVYLPTVQQAINGSVFIKSQMLFYKTCLESR